MLPTIETKYEDSVMKASDSLKESETYIKAIQKELEENNQLSIESKTLFSSMLSKLDQVSEMSNMDKLKSIFDSGYIKETIDEKIKDEKEKKLLLDSFSSLRLAILKSTSFTSVLTGVLRKSIGSIVGLYASSMDLPPIVTFMTTRLGDLLGSFLQRRADKKERKAALEEKIRDEKESAEENRSSYIEREDTSDTEEIPQQLSHFEETQISANDELYDKLNAAGKAFIEDFRLGISEELDTVLKSAQVSDILKLLQHQDEIIEAINSELENHLIENKESYFKPENINDDIEARDTNRKMLNLLNDISEGTKNKPIDTKKKDKSSLEKIIPFIVSGFGSLLTGLGKTLFAIGDKLTFGLLGLLKDISVSAISKLGPSLISAFSNPGVLAALGVAATAFASKYMEDINEKLRKAGMAATEEGKALNSTAVNPEDVLNEKGKEDLKKFQEGNKFSKMSVKDQGALAWYRMTGNEEKVNEILNKYSVEPMDEKQRSNVFEEQSNKAKETRQKIERILHDNNGSLTSLDKNYSVLLEENKKIEETKNNNSSKSSGNASVVVPTTVSAPQTNINNTTVNNSSIFQRTTLMTDPGIHYALGSSFR